jgi:hypothetical protein
LSNKRFVETIGDKQSTSRSPFDPKVKCKIHTKPILMHQMHISKCSDYTERGS